MPYLNKEGVSDNKFVLGDVCIINEFYLLYNKRKVRCKWKIHRDFGLGTKSNSYECVNSNTLI